MNIHERIKELRLSIQLSQKELAEELNEIQIDNGDSKVFTQTISYWENGREPNLNGLRKLARFFNCSTDFLLDESDIKNWSEFSALSELSNKPVEAFANYLKVQFDEDIAMAILDSFKELMVRFTNISMMAEGDMQEWEEEIVDTLNLIPLLLTFVQDIRRFQYDVHYLKKRLEKNDDLFFQKHIMTSYLDKYIELEKNVIGKIQETYKNLLIYPGIIDAESFLSEKELQKRKEKRVEEIKRTNPEVYETLKRVDDKLISYNLLTKQAESFDAEWIRRIEENQENSKLKRRDR